MKVKNILLIFALYSFSLSNLFGQWESIGDNIIPQNHRVWSIKLAPDKSIWAISSVNQAPPTNQFPIVHRSNDEGLTWGSSIIPQAFNNSGNDLSPIDSMHAFIAVSDAGLHQTFDGGENWKKIGSYPFRSIFVHFFNKDEGWVYGVDFSGSSSQQVMSLTTDGGQTWTHVGNGEEPPEGTSIPMNTSDFSAVVFSAKSTYDVHNNTIIMGRTSGEYWKSDDKGYNWTAHETPLMDFNIRASNVAIKDENTFMISGDVLSGSSMGLPSRNYTTFDGGLTWEVEGLSGVTASATQYIPNTDSIFIMVGHNDFGWGQAGTSISYDYGKTWKIIGNNAAITIDFLDENTGVGTCCALGLPSLDGQIYKWNFNLLTSTFEIVESDRVKVMPNPVQDHLTIHTGAEFQANTLTIEITSMNGQSVLLENHPNANQIFVSTDRLPKGIYALRISDGEKNVLKKFVKISGL